MKRSDMAGREFDWFGLDPNEHIAVFSTAGWGSVPDLVFLNLEVQKVAEALLGDLVGYNLRSDWNEMLKSLSEGGVFFYDWEQSVGPYVRLVKPKRPISVRSLGISLPAIDGLVRFEKLSFAGSERISPEYFFECTS